jgi:hypothetical protein
MCNKWNVLSWLCAQAAAGVEEGMLILKVSNKVLITNEHHVELLSLMQKLSRKQLVSLYNTGIMPTFLDLDSQAFCRRLLKVFMPHKMAWGYLRHVDGKTFGDAWYAVRQNSVAGRCKL